MVLDAATQANLELVEARGGGRDTSLLAALDRTVTPMGARKLRDWDFYIRSAISPLLRQRQQTIADLLAEPFLLGNICAKRSNPSAISNAPSGGSRRLAVTSRDLQVLRMSLGANPAAAGRSRSALNCRASAPLAIAPDALPAPGERSACHLQVSRGGHPQRDLHPLPHVVDLLAKAIVDEPPGLDP